MTYVTKVQSPICPMKPQSDDKGQRNFLFSIKKCNKKFPWSTPYLSSCFGKVAYFFNFNFIYLACNIQQDHNGICISQLNLQITLLNIGTFNWAKLTPCLIVVGIVILILLLQNTGFTKHEYSNYSLVIVYIAPIETSSNSKRKDV